MIRRLRSRHNRARPTLLFISPVVPALAGNGLAMRAAQTLLALARHYDASLLVLVRYWSPAGEEVPAPIRRVCRDVGVVPPTVADAALAHVAARRFDVVHVFRLATVPLVQPFLDRLPSAVGRWLDLDDIESTTLRRIAALHRLHGDEARARRAEIEAATAELAEWEAFVRFDRVFVAAPPNPPTPFPPTLGGKGEDGAEPVVVSPPPGIRGERLGGGSLFTVWPNVLQDVSPLPPPPTDGPRVVLFVGTLGYYPNAEGVVWFAEDVFPRIRAATDVPVEFRIVGQGYAPELRALRRLAGVRLVGAVPDVRPHYTACHVAVAPIRAGGGTRIKIVEAFALGRPVVATSIGAEGIDARDGEELLLADAPEMFAACCLAVLNDRELATRLVANGRRLFSERYVADRLAAIVGRAPAPPPRRGSGGDDRPPAPS